MASCASGLVDKGRMIWKDFVRIYEGVGVKLSRATRLLNFIYLSINKSNLFLDKIA